MPRVLAVRARLHFWWHRFLCRWRHDWEVEAVSDDGRKALLVCFYCDRHRVGSINPIATFED